MPEILPGALILILLRGLVIGRGRAGGGALVLRIIAALGFALIFRLLLVLCLIRLHDVHFLPVFQRIGRIDHDLIAGHKSCNDFNCLAIIAADGDRL